MDYQDDPWNTPDVHKNHKHAAEPPKPAENDEQLDESNGLNTNGNGNGVHESPAAPPVRTTSTFTTSVTSTAPDEATASARQNSYGPSQLPGGAWGGEFFGSGAVNPENNPSSPFGPEGTTGGREHGEPRPVPTSRTIGSGRTGTALEETIIVTLMPEKEGMFMFQHHNYEVASARRGSKVIRRYSDFVWLLDCLHKRYPFRVLPLLPPKRVAGTSILAFCQADLDIDSMVQSTATTFQMMERSSRSVVVASLDF